MAGKSFSEWTKERLGDEEEGLDTGSYSGISSKNATGNSDRRSFSQWTDSILYGSGSSDTDYQKIWRNKYSNKSYDDLERILGSMNQNSDEYIFLSGFAQSVMNEDDYDKRINARKSQLETLIANKTRGDQIKNTLAYMSGQMSSANQDPWSMYDVNSQDYDGKISSLQEELDGYGDYDKDIEDTKRELFDLENRKKYNLSVKNPDFAEKSKYVSTELSGKWERNTSQYGAGYGDVVHEYINNPKSRSGILRDAAKFRAGNAPVVANHYELMTSDEVAIYNYLYNTEGKKSAEEYLDYIQYDLNSRYMSNYQKQVAAYASGGVGNAVAASAASVPMNMASGIGYLDVVGQKAVNYVREKLTGEYRPVDYNRNSMAYSVGSSTIRGTVAQEIADSTGVIDIPEDKYPTLARIFNGKGLSDVYQLGMSMVDSATIGIMTAAGIPGGTVLLAGSAASQGILDAVQKGATEEQAITMGLFNGFFEYAFERWEIDGMLNNISGGKMPNIINQILTEGAGEGMTTIANTMADSLIMAEKSDWQKGIAGYLEQGYSQQEAEKMAFRDAAIQVMWDSIGGALMGGLSTAGGIAINTAAKSVYDAQINPIRNARNYNTYQSAQNELVDTALELNPDDAYAKKLKEKLDSGEKLSGRQTSKILTSNERSMYDNDKKTIRNAVLNRLTELGEMENVEALSDALAKQASGEELSGSEQAAISGSKYGQRVANELNPENIRSGEYSSSWAEQLNTDRINWKEYSRMIDELDTDTAENGADSAAKSETTPFVDRKNATVNAPMATNSVANGGGNAATSMGTEGKATNVNNIVESTDSRNSASYTLENEAKKYGNQAKAFVANYNEGQDIGQYSIAFNAAYNYGKHGANKDAAMAKPSVQYLTDEQRSIAYEIGADSPDSVKNTGSRSGTAVRSTNNSTDGKKKSYGEYKKGTVRMDDGTSVKAVRKKLNAQQRRVYDAVFVFAEYSGYDIVLGMSSPDSDGNFLSEEGSYKWDSNTIYIDLNSGLHNITDAQDLANYTAIRTFTHELNHSNERNNPLEYEEFRKLVLDWLANKLGEIEAGKENPLTVDDIIKRKMKLYQAKVDPNFTYEQASREVVADAMVDILQDSKFMQMLYERHKPWYQKIVDKLKEFVANLRAYFADMDSATKKEAYYLQLNPDGTMKYMQDIVDAFDKLTVGAIENYQAEQVLSESGIAVDSETDAGSIFSVRDVLDDTDREKVAAALVDRFGVTKEEAKKWLTAETSLASLILNPKYSSYLDYEADPNEVAIKQNSDYPQGTVDFSNICKKRREFTQVMNRILRNFPNHVFAATDLAKIRTIMGEEGMTLPCGICYVEDRRQLDTIVAQDFIDGLKLYREGSKTRPDGKPFNANQLKGLKLTDGDTYVPTIYELVSLEGRNSLKAKNPNMEAAWVKYNNARGMQSVRLLTNEAEYKRQILKYSQNTVQSKNDKGGLRIYSFSDAEMFHLIDIIQVITDSSAVGLYLQGYTKVNEYAKAVKDTGEKLNRSLIPKGDLGYHMENGKVVLDYDTVEGIDIYHEDFFDNKDNPNVGNITIGINDTQIRAAMVSDFVDQIIPFHTGQSEEVLGEKGIAAWNNYKDFQTEKDIATGKTSSHQINIYIEVIQAAENEGKPIQNKRQFVEKFLQVCKENGLQPRFSQFLNVDSDGNYVYTEGYHKFLVDFKTFAQTEVGEYLPQMPVKPIFDDAYITGLLEAYVKEQQVKDAEVAKQMPRVIERITNEIIKPDSEEETVDNLSLIDKNSIINTTSRGDSVDNRRVRKGTAEAARNAGANGGANSGSSKNAQEIQKWGNLDTKVRGRVKKLVKNHINESPNSGEIYILLCSYVGKTDETMTPYFYGKAVNILTEKVFDDAMTLNPVIFENKWSVLGGSITNIYRDIRNEFDVSEEQVTHDDRDLDVAYATDEVTGQNVQYEIRNIEGELLPVIDTKNDTRNYDVAEAYLKSLVDTDKPFATILVDAQPVYIGTDLPSEYRGSKYTQKMNSRLRSVKMQAATNLDEMLLLAENGEWRENVKEKHKIDAKNGWYRYETKFAVPVLDTKKAVDHYTVYSGTLLIRNDADGKSYLYDLLDINKEKVISASSFSDKNRSEVFAPKPSQAQYMQEESESQAQDSGSAQYSIRENETKAFLDDIDDWNKRGRPTGESFTLGYTGDVLQGLGAIESDIYMDGDKINKIISDHKEMSLDVIKQVPQILNDPILVLKSRNVRRASSQNSRIIIFGDVKAKNGQPVMAILDLRPVENGFVIDDMQKVNSAYTKDNDPVGFIRSSEVLYADKKRTTLILRTVGFQMPIELTQSGYIGSISYHGQNVNISGKIFEDIIGRSQNQLRESSLTGTDILMKAYESVKENDARFNWLNDAQRDALDIFGKRVNTLRDAQAKRLELLAHKADLIANKETRQRGELSKVQNRLDTVNAIIKKAETDLTETEDKKIVKQILKQSRRIVERDANDRWRDEMRVYKNKQNETAESRKYRKQITDTAMTMSEWLRKNSDKEHIPEILKKPVAELLTSIDFSSKRFLNGGEMTQADKKFGANMAELQKLLKGQQGAYDGEDGAVNDVGAYLDLSVENRQFLDDLVRVVASADGPFTINTMNTEQLHSFSKFMKNLATAIRKANSTLANARYQNIPDMAHNSMEHFEAMGNAKSTDGNPISKFLSWTNATPYYAFKRYGEAGEAIFDGLTRGWEKFAFNSKEIIDFTNKTYSSNEVREWRSKIHIITLESGKKVQMTTAQIMELSQLLNREQARKHIEAGGVRIGNIDTGKGVLQDVNHHHMTITDLQNIVGLLTHRQLDVATKMRKWMGERGGEWGNEISMARFGYEFYTEGEDYYPICTDANGRPMKDTDEQNNSMFRLLNLSFSKSLNPRANNALVVSDIFDTFADHMADMAKLNGLGLPLLDAIKWYNYTERTNNPDGTMDEEGVKKSMEKAFGTAAGSYFKTLMKDINGVREAGDRGGTFASKMISNYKIAAVGANLRVALLQPTSYLRAMAIINPKNMANALMFKKNAYNEAMQYSGTAVWKSLGYYDTDISRSLRSQIEHDETWMDNVKEKSMVPAEFGDKVTWGRLWVACKLEAKYRNPSLSGENLKNATADIFRDVIYATQVMDSTLTRSEMMRGTTKWTKLASAFMSEPTLSMNILMDAASQFAIDSRKVGNRSALARNKGKIGLAFTTYAITAAAAAIVESIADAFRDDDEYETFVEKFLQAFFGEKSILDGNLFQDLTIIGKIPLLKNIISTLRGSKSSDMSIASIESLSNAYNIWRETIQLATGKLDKPTSVTWNGKMTDFGKIYNSLKALSQMVGLPVANMTRDVTAIWNTIVGSIDNDLIIHTYDAGDEANIRFAYKDGYLTEEEAINELMAGKDADGNPIVNDRNEAWFKVQSWENGSTAKYASVYDAMLNGGDVNGAVRDMVSHGESEDDVRTAIKNKVGELYREHTISKQQAASMLRSYTDLDSDEIQKNVNKWSCVVVTGIKYDDIDDEYMSGRITASRAIDMYTLYGTMDRETAVNKVAELKFRKENSELAEKINFTQYNKWKEFGEPSGVDIEMYADVVSFRDLGDNKTRDKEEVMAYIDGLNISRYAKQALGRCFYAESTLKKAPWNN